MLKNKKKNQLYLYQSLINEYKHDYGKKKCLISPQY